MVRIAIVAALAALLLAAFGCSDFTAPPRFEGDVFVLAGVLYAGSPIDARHPIYITKSASIEQFNALDLFVFNAQITITDLDANHSFNLTGVPDFEQFKFYYIDPGGHLIQAGHTYAIEVIIPGTEQKLSAETSVPLQAELLPDFYNHGGGYSLDETQMNQLIYQDLDSSYPLVLDTKDAGGAYPIIGEFYCLEEFSTSLEFTTPVMGIQYADAHLEEAYNAPGGSLRRIIFMGRYMSQNQPGMDGNYLLIKDYKQAMVFYGRYQISLHIVDNNYYNYSFMPEGYLYGGVKGGLGYFGSASGGTMYGQIVKQALP